MAAATRILRGVSAVISFTNVDQNGTAAAAAGAVTVGVTKANGTVLVAPGTATASGGPGIYQLTLTAANVATLDTLTATWTDAGDGSTHTTYVEICGGFYFAIAELRAFDSKLTIAVYPDATVLQQRLEVETDIEEVAEQAFVLRHRRELVDGYGTPTILVGHRPRTIRAASTIASDGTATALNAAELATLRLTEAGELVRSDGACWPAGTSNVIVEYEHGEDQVPTDIRRAALELARTRLVDEAGPGGDRATSFTTIDGQGTYKLATPGLRSTGLPRVDAVLARHSNRIPGMA
jgi:hypothetical protein